MAYPDYSEFTFGYAVTRALEDLFASKMIAPKFPTAAEEKNHGYDVEITKFGTPIFVQFKRSEIMKRKSCREIKNHDTTLVNNFFRMNLNKDDEYRQHYLLQELERKGNVVLYCTSAFENKQELDGYYAADKILDKAVFFSPCDVVLQNTYENHHVSFNHEKDYAYLFSDMPIRIYRRYPTFDKVFETIRIRGLDNWERDFSLLKTTQEELDRIGANGLVNRSRIRAPAKRDPDRYATEYRDLSSAMQIVDSQELPKFPPFPDTRALESVVQRIAINLFKEADIFTFFIKR